MYNKDKINIPPDEITRNTCCKVEQSWCISISLSLSLSFTPKKPNSRVKCFWREEAQLNRESSASKTWPPFFLALSVPSVLPCAMLICYLLKQMLGTATPRHHHLHSTACWCSALTLCTPPLLPGSTGGETTEICTPPPRLLPATERPASAWQRTQHREVKGSRRSCLAAYAWLTSTESSPAPWWSQRGSTWSGWGSPTRHKDTSSMSGAQIN